MRVKGWYVQDLKEWDLEGKRDALMKGLGKEVAIKSSDRDHPVYQGRIVGVDTIKGNYLLKDSKNPEKNYDLPIDKLEEITYLTSSEEEPDSEKRCPLRVEGSRPKYGAWEGD